MADNLIDSPTAAEADFAFCLFGLTEAAKAIFAIEEVERLFTVREKVSDFVERRESGSIFEQLRLVLTYTASTSRIFWPASSNSKVKRRCKRLRALVRIDENHPLSDRALRNHVEHFDERLDDWFGGSPRPFAGFEVAVHEGKKSSTVEALKVSVPFLFFERDLEMRLFGHSYLLADLKTALIDICDKISETLD